MPEAPLSCAEAVAENIVKILSARKMTIAAAESCTGGMAADLIVCVPGASKVFWGSFVCYTKDAKIKMLGIPEALLKDHGVVSREAAAALAEGALKKSGASWAFSVTGLAGPDGDGSNEVGTVWIAAAGAKKGEAAAGTEARKYLFGGGRGEVRKKAALAALELVLEKISQ